MSLYQENKTCGKCHKPKNIDREFTSPTASWCKPCNNIAAKERHAKKKVLNCVCQDWTRAGVIKEVTKLSGHHPTCKNR